MSSNKPRASEVVERWFAPTQGTLRNFPVHKIPEDALFNNLNVILRNGRLRNRPGMISFAAQSLGGRVSGAFTTTSLDSGAYQSNAFQNDAFQVSALTPGFTIIAGTDSKLWALIAGNWSDRTGTALSGTAALPVRFTSLEINSVIWIMAVNGRNTPQKWDQAAATFVDITGNPPIFTDVTSASDRIIGIIPPYTIRWGNSLDLGTWPAANFRTLADTPDKLRAIRNLGTQGVVAYKARSIWIGNPLGSTDATFFKFNIRRIVDGPGGPNAIVDALGTHYYMTENGRIGLFDGFTHRWIADGIWPLIRAKIDQEKAFSIHGTFNSITGEIQFFFPTTDKADVQGMATVIPPIPEQGVKTFIGFVGETAIPITASVTRLGGTKDIILFEANTFMSLKYKDDVDDFGTAFSGFWQTGLRPSFLGDPFRLDNIETFVERGANSGTLNIAPVTSNILDVEGGTIGSSKAIDLTQVKVKVPIGFDVRARFQGLRYSFTAPVKVRYHGSQITARKVE